jgi:hypothetical protein
VLLDSPQLAQVSTDKADISSLESFTTRVSTAFETVGSSVVRDAQAAGEDAARKLRVIQEEVAAIAATAARKADTAVLEVRSVAAPCITSRARRGHAVDDTVG